MAYSIHVRLTGPYLFFWLAVPWLAVAGTPLGETLKRAILTSVFLTLAGAIFALPQTNTFCSNNLACTVSGLWNFAGGLQSGGIAVATSPVNLATGTSGTIALATQTSGTLPAASLPATTSPCSGAQLAIGLSSGGTSNCATPPTFVASGASHAVGYVPDPGSSAGTTHFLREDANWAVVPAAGVQTVYNTIASAAAATINSTTMVTAPGSDTNYDFGALLAQTVATAGCGTQPSFQIEIIYTDAFTGGARTLLPLVNQLGNSGTFNNAQSFAAALSAATTFSVRMSLRAKASTTVSYTVVYSPGTTCAPGASYSIAPVLLQE
jgi:hypothetical protein